MTSNFNYRFEDLSSAAPDASIRIALKCALFSPSPVLFLGRKGDDILENGTVSPHPNSS